MVPHSNSTVYASSTLQFRGLEYFPTISYYPWYEFHPLLKFLFIHHPPPHLFSLFFIPTLRQTRVHMALHDAALDASLEVHASSSHGPWPFRQFFGHARFSPFALTPLFHPSPPHNSHMNLTSEKKKTLFTHFTLWTLGYTSEVRVTWETFFFFSIFSQKFFFSIIKNIKFFFWKLNFFSKM